MNAWNRNVNDSYSVVSPVDLQTVMRQVYVWMLFGLLVTAGMAYVTVATPLINLVANPIVMLVAIVAELGLVLVISLGFNRLPASVAALLFFAYAAVNGFTLSIVLLAFTTGSIFWTFVATAALFGAMSIVGYTTHVDLTKLGTFLIMGVLGLVIVSVVNIFVHSGPLDFLISAAGVLIFTGLTAYDTQRIGRMAAQMSQEGEAGLKFGIMGALRLYLDFINMFLFMLRLTGRRR